jgi:hypothetical protein
MNTILANVFVIKWEHVGSRVTCNPPPTDTDDDYLLLVSDHRSFRNDVLLEGFEIGGSMWLDSHTPLESEDRFSSYTKGQVNLIVTQDEIFYRKFIAATVVAKRLNLMSKEDRIALFQAVLYGVAK